MKGLGLKKDNKLMTIGKKELKMKPQKFIFKKTDNIKNKESYFQEKVNEPKEENFLNFYN